MGKKRIALVTGGYSGESVISYQSAQTVFNNVDRERYEVFVIDIRKDGWWFDPQAVNRPDRSMKAGHPAVEVDRSDFSILADNEKIRFDAALMCLHGTPGEDGKLSGYFDMIGLPYTSCGAAVSALTFNKRYTVAVAAFGGIAVARSLHLFKGGRPDARYIAEQLRLPVFIKPNNGGSSIGMSKVTKEEDLEPALDKAFAEDDQVLVEEFVRGREFTIGVYRRKGQVLTLPMTEIIPDADSDFFDYEAKYHGKSREITPADAPQAAAWAVRDAAARIYTLLGCRGVVRIDFIYNEADSRPYMLEVNTVPGQSAASLIPQQLAAARIPLSEFYSDLIEEALT